MAEHFEEVVSVRIAELAQSVDARFDAVDAQLKEVARFDEVQRAFLEQRDFTKFCFDKLRGEMVRGHDGLTANLGRLERRLDRHEVLLSEILTEVKARR